MEESSQLKHATCHPTGSQRVRIVHHRIELELLFWATGRVSEKPPFAPNRHIYVMIGNRRGKFSGSEYLHGTSYSSIEGIRDAVHQNNPFLSFRPFEGVVWICERGLWNEQDMAVSGLGVL